MYVFLYKFHNLYGFFVRFFHHLKFCSSTLILTSLDIVYFSNSLVPPLSGVASSKPGKDKEARRYISLFNYRKKIKYLAIKFNDGGSDHMIMCIRRHQQ